MQLGSSAGVAVVLDCGGADTDVNPELLNYLTIISPNESELANLTGMASPDMARKQNYVLICCSQGLYSALCQEHVVVFCLHTSPQQGSSRVIEIAQAYTIHVE